MYCMKRSNRLLLLLSIALVTGMFITNVMLAENYRHLNLEDPFKNFQDVAVRPFRALKISGGNGYAIRIQYGAAYGIKLMNSRKSFFFMNQQGDTVSIRFQVARQKDVSAEGRVTGLIIYCPDLHFLQSSGTCSLLGPLHADSLSIIQDSSSFTKMDGLKSRQLALNGTAGSWFHFSSDNVVEHLRVKLDGDAGVNMQSIRFSHIEQQLSGNAMMIFFAQAMTDWQQAMREER